MISLFPPPAERITAMRFYTITDPELSLTLSRIRRTEGVKAAKAAAESIGYSVRWDRQGSMYLRDLGA